jgi:predicted acylesterase/phospholipase RssA
VSTPRIALVLGAGGVAGGAFHAGALAALHDALGWDARSADLVVGTSAGSLAETAMEALRSEKFKDAIELFKNRAEYHA